VGTGRASGLGGRLGGNPYLLLTLAGLMWGGNAVAARLAVGEASPMTITALRWLTVVLVLAPVAGSRIRAEWPALAPHWLFVFLLGALGYTAFNAVFYLAGHSTSAINLGLIQGVVPGLVLVGAFLLHGTAIRARQAIGLALALLGVAVAVSRADPEVIRHLSFAPGDLWMLGACLLYAGYSLALRRRPPVSPITLFAGMSAAAFVSSLPLLAWEAAVGATTPPTLYGLAIIAYIGVFPSLLGQLFYLRGIELIGPGRASQFMNLIPVFAALLGVLIAQDTFAPYHAVALGLVVGGIWLAERGRPEAG
jgi:drug/metabolite transporter (DMT)-like permease